MEGLPEEEGAARTQLEALPKSLATLAEVLASASKDLTRLLANPLEPRTTCPSPARCSNPHRPHTLSRTLWSVRSILLGPASFSIAPHGLEGKPPSIPPLSRQRHRNSIWRDNLCPVAIPGGLLRAHHLHPPALVCTSGVESLHRFCANSWSMLLYLGGIEV